MKKLLLISILALSGCISSRTHLIGIRTGEEPTYTYNNQFNSKARKACGGAFKVLEKSAHPKALQDSGTLIDPYHFYWVVRCN